MKRVIINADDFGLSPGTNAAIVACSRAGSVSSTTLMVNMPPSEDAARLAKRTPALGVGLHFNLTSGAPVCHGDEVASLVGADGLFLSRHRAAKRAFFRQLEAKDIRRELEAQAARFCSFDLTPTHIDSHQHIHAYPIVFDVLAGFCVERGLPLRIPWVWKPPLRLPLRRRMRMSMLKALIARNTRRWRGQLRTNAAFASIFDLQVAPEAVSEESYRHLLRYNHADPLELMVHPADADAAHRHMTGISSISAREYDVLTSSDLGAVARQLGYEVIDYARL